MRKNRSVSVASRPESATTQLENSQAFIRSLKGPPLSVFLALMCTNQSMSNEELQVWTSYGHEAVTLATRALTHLGLISAGSRRGPWSIAKGCPIPLTLQSGGEGGISALRIYSSPPPPSIEESAQEREQEGATNEDFPRLRRALLDSGICEPAASKLARLPHVTREYIQAHVEAAEESAFGLGMAIYRMQRAWPAPQTRASRSREVEAKIRRFVEGR